MQKPQGCCKDPTGNHGSILMPDNLPVAKQPFVSERIPAHRRGGKHSITPFIPLLPPILLQILPINLAWYLNIIAERMLITAQQVTTAAVVGTIP